ncbi:HEAT repeat domain-containing protein [Polaribacter pectinis]|uniref:HEAT repeat domain-containing protein n=1 Tax=Polaribacter pectinis TaxID=2738844 RepID=A0A7G9LEU3_9FLAO|nr:zf-HC2 domain-containing protein [Polaribacter pectinis]QNM87142.1 HEAT repeat domain-containing protein [Polaribacter pectinis]
MKCTEIQNQFTDYLEGSVSEVANSDVKEHLNSCANCYQELEELKSFLTILDNEKLDIPSANLRMNFEKMLAKEIEKEQPKVVQLQPEQNWKTYLRVAASVLIVISAFLIGKYESNVTKIANNYQVEKQQVLALLENSSASKRILAVTNAEEFTKKDTKIIDALINRLFFDNNANVRSAAAEALSKFSTEMIVRDALIKSLETEKNASVQIELIEILAKIQEKRAVESMEKILKNEETPQYVKQQIELNLPSLL